MNRVTSLGNLGYIHDARSFQRKKNKHAWIPTMNDYDYQEPLSLSSIINRGIPRKKVYSKNISSISKETRKQNCRPKLCPKYNDCQNTVLLYVELNEDTAVLYTAEILNT